MWLLSKFQNVSPNDEYSITALKDVYINYIYEDIYRNMHSIAIENLDHEPTKILEIGAGSLSKAQKYFSSIQLSDGSSVSKFGKENQLIAEDLPFENAIFDLIIAKDTLHHFSDAEQALSEISRVLKPGGLFIVSEPYWSLLGRFVFRCIHPEKWKTKPNNLRNTSSNPFDANQATLLLLKGSRFNHLVSQNSLVLEFHGSTYGISYLLSGGLNWRNKIPSGLLKGINKLEVSLKTLKYLTGLNVLASFKKI
jgi:SAM-dependent methyltransferase